MSEQDAEVLKITLLKFIGSRDDKIAFLRSRGWTSRYSSGGQMWDKLNSDSFYTEWRELDEAMDCEVRFILTGKAGFNEK